jgi:glycosyltransferase involved in cell wall biosynthesis
VKKLIRITTVPISLDKLLHGQLQFMSRYFEVTAVSSEKEYLEKIGEREGVSTFHLEMTRQITPLKDLLSLVRLVVFLKKNQPFIVHSHTPKAGIIGMMAAKIAGVPHRIHTVAGLPLLEAKGMKRKVLNFVEKLTYSCSTAVYPNSKGLYEIILENQFCEANKLKVLANGSSNGINTAFFNSEIISEEEKNALRIHLGILPDDFVFVFVGRLVSDKGINELVSAFTKLDNEKCKLILVGPLESELDPLLPQTLHQIENHVNIITVGYQNDVRPYFSISNCLTFPSYREGFPNVVLQAGSHGLPCIVSDINGCNEIIVHQKNGLIIPVKNEEILRETMQLLLLDFDLVAHLRKNARSMIVDRYEQNVVWDALLQEYQKLD